MTRRPFVVSFRIDLTARERDLILRGLFELTITYVEDHDPRQGVKGVVMKVGGDREAMFFDAH